jgi:hypothetical protein
MMLMSPETTIGHFKMNSLVFFIKFKLAFVCVRAPASGEVPTVQFFFSQGPSIGSIRRQKSARLQPVASFLPSRRI